MILRFMGDLPEPKLPVLPPESKESTSLTKKIYGSISRKFGGSKLAEEISREVL